MSGSELPDHACLWMCRLAGSFAEEEEMRARRALFVPPSTLIGAGLDKLASPGRVDAGQVDVAVDDPEHGTQTHQD